MHVLCLLTYQCGGGCGVSEHGDSEEEIQIKISSRESTFHKIIEDCKTRMWPRIPKMQKEWHYKKDGDGNTMEYHSYPSWIENLKKKTL